MKDLINDFHKKFKNEAVLKKLIELKNLSTVDKISEFLLREMNYELESFTEEQYNKFIGLVMLCMSQVC